MKSRRKSLSVHLLTFLLQTACIKPEILHICYTVYDVGGHAPNTGQNVFVQNTSCGKIVHVQITEMVPYPQTDTPVT